MFGLHVSTFLPPFAPRPLRRFIATMKALTPGQVSLLDQVSLLHVLCLFNHSVANHLKSSCRRFCTLPLSSTGFLLVSGLGFAHSPRARHNSRPNRVRFPTDWLITSCYSPRPSLVRSCIRLQAGERMPEEDLHLPDSARSQAYGPPSSSSALRLRHP